MSLRSFIAKIVGHIYRLVEVKEPTSHHIENHKPWGSFIVVERGIGYRIKKLKISPKSSLSLQKHKFRSEHWVIVSGTAEVQIGDEMIGLVEVGASVFVSAGTKHRIKNPSDTMLKIIEVQIGEIDESDIIRYEDEYGRV